MLLTFYKYVMRLLNYNIDTLIVLCIQHNEEKSLLCPSVDVQCTEPKGHLKFNISHFNFKVPYKENQRLKALLFLNEGNLRG